MSAPSQSTQVFVTAMTHRGAVRANNEDSLVAGPATVSGTSMTEPVVIRLPLRGPVVIAVADGLGGHAAGEVASALAVRRLAEEGPELTGRDAVVSTLARINDELYEIPGRQPEYYGTGTTAAGLVLSESGALWFNVGDSRVYRADPGYLGQLSIDDTAGGGEGTGRRSPVLAQALGGAALRTPVEPHVAEDPVEGPARWLLCSDGLTDMVDAVRIERILAEESTSDLLAVRALWAEAMNAGGHDNITILLVRWPGPRRDSDTADD
ncbi:Serine/threonine protein phosphatase PrpC [Streptoalloteichus tenebrarius]|uniref:Serine/threonine protein phosphatase PrpC n=1 Tax=Streptoalloteichus tenebrarius (strain ATCC 17920 / DSM 40477 / JCM 4838 / CBS 697.72 / NBRC 16177 / NCIMB 11028 / NRRL B-12390 / A12253. 1 / ISP 5477) TaxID=1933 RepID=A0ABT1HX02_STRSD|nr:PP2C family serine/threonine-protein phosphatase [Streptoalloteichus tenebrarius]MCP2260035.1 Serine/threonine protein phosphatase PrpC [Streptoalloteichus tenebrarius]BFF03848.1 protein phosphatase 2C domain-containing protein [Streptoalloteichus tenebrarius]